MNSVVVIICAYLLGTILEGIYMHEYYFKIIEDTGSFFSLPTVLWCLLILLVLLVAIVKEKNQGLKLIQIGIVLFFATYSYQKAINRVEYFKTHNIRFYKYTEE